MSSTIKLVKSYSIRKMTVILLVIFSTNLILTPMSFSGLTSNEIVDTDTNEGKITNEELNALLTQYPELRQDYQPLNTSISIPFFDSDGYLYVDDDANYRVQVFYSKATTPTIDSPSDVTYSQGDTGYSITWDPTADSPHMYNITKDGIVVQSGTWNSSSEKITMIVDGLNPGTYYYRCSVNDTLGSWIYDEVAVTVTAANNVPTVSNLTISPGSPITVHILVASYDYSDVDDDPENGTEIIWYRDRVGIVTLQYAYNNTLSIPASVTLKGDQWWFGIRPSDGFDFGSWINSSTVTILNTPPEAFNLIITSNPRTADDLVASWTFYDVDPNDTQVAFKITWIRNGVYLPALDNKTTVEAGNTTKDDEWLLYDLQVFDGEAWSTLLIRYTVVIRNTPPTASNLIITSNPTSAGDLVASWTFNDVDPNDTQVAFKITWYRNGVHLPALNDKTTVEAGNTSKGESWQYYLQVFDGDEWSFTSSSPTTVIPNTAPTASNLQITPVTPATNDSLVASYLFSDVDGDAESGTEIIWYRDRDGTVTLQHAYNSTLSIPASATLKGDQWWFGVRPSDGFDFGSWINSSTVTILNTAPTASSLTITSIPTTANDLVASWTFNDVDPNDTQVAFRITWSRDGVHLPALDNKTTVEAGNTSKSEFWLYSLQVFDGEAWSITFSSPPTMILNTAPTASNLQITPVTPATNDSLVASYLFSDVDGDAESGTEIIWYRDGTLQGALNGSTTVASSYTSVGETWYFLLHPADGHWYGNWYSSPSVIINPTVNSPPTASNLVIAPGIPLTADDLVASYVYDDPDGHSESGTEIAWYLSRGGSITLQHFYNNSLIIPANATLKGDQWWFGIHPKDGFIFGTWVNSTTITVLNTAPTASDLVLPSVTTVDDLVAGWTFNDMDGDSQVNHNITWFKDGIHQPALDNLTTVPATYTSKGESWDFTFQVFDGEAWSVSYNSPAITVTLGPVPPTIDSPVDVFYTHGDTGHSITWNPADIDPHSYTITRNGSLITSGTWNNSAETITISVDGLAPGTHVYRCTVTDSLGQWTYDDMMITVMARLPSPPQDFEAVAEENQVILVWDEPGDNGSSDIIEYRIYRSTYPVDYTFLASTDSTYFIDTAVSNDITYYYVVTAVNLVGESNHSNEVTATPSTTTTPTTTTKLTTPGFYFIWSIIPCFIVVMIMRRKRFP